MSIDDELEQRIRSALHAGLDPLDPPGDMVERLRAQHARARRQRRTNHRRALRLPTGSLTLSLGSAIAIAIAITVVVAANHGAMAPTAARVPPAARALVAKLAILRRPQTTADRSFDANQIEQPNVHVIGGLTRLARVLPNGMRLFLLVINLSRQATRGDLLAVATVSPSGSANTAVVGTAARLIPSSPGPFGYGPLSDTSYASLVGRPGTLVYYEVVPDAVTRVRWVFPRQTAGQPGDMVPGTPGKIFHNPLLVAVTVHDNVAAIEMPSRGPTATDTWYGAGTHVIASHGTTANLYGISKAREPGPQTALSRRAERNPSTPNPLHVTPAVGGRHTRFTVRFTALTTGTYYRFVITGGPRQGCAPAYGSDNYGPGLRGHQFILTIGPRKSGWCPGTYDVSSAVNGRHAPFGHALITVR